MPRLACVDAPAFPLQLFLRRCGECASLPAAVVDRDKPTGRLLWVNEAARRAAILPGMTYAEGLSLAATLRAAVVPPHEIAQGIDELTEALRRFSPEIEPSREEPGVFWLNAAGLHRLNRSATQWAKDIRADLATRGIAVSVAVGYRRFGAYAAGKAKPDGVTIFGAWAQEDEAVRRAPLDRLPLEPAARDALARLGIRTVGEFMQLPAAGISRRFGKAAKRLHEMAEMFGADPSPDPSPKQGEERRRKGIDQKVGALLAAPSTSQPRAAVPQVGAHRDAPTVGGSRTAPTKANDEPGAADPLACALTPAPVHEAIEETCQFEPPDGDAMRLLFAVQGMVRRLLARLAEKGLALAGIEARFTLEDAAPRIDALRPAEPTLREPIVLDLLRLRLEGAPLPAPAIDLTLAAEETPANLKQLRLFFERPKRDLEAGERALARLRAELGPDAVLRATLHEGHLPEARFAWTPFEQLTAPQAHDRPHAALVRRLRTRPELLPYAPHREPDGRLVRALGCGPIDRLFGPFVVSGGWWRRETNRQYYFAQTRRGDLLWLYYDAVRRRWFLHGEVE
jgi:protein ImuB